jgi:hypothetical protein
MRHKTITLCLNSFEVASRMNNFSAWVRRKLLEESDQEGLIITEITKIKYECRLCGLNYARPYKQIWNCQSCFAELTEAIE